MVKCFRFSGYPFSFLLMFCWACNSGPISNTPAREYISWKEHLIDSPELTGVDISGSDGLVMADLDQDGFEDVISVHEADVEYDGVQRGFIRIAFGSEDPERWENITLAEGIEAAAAEDVDVADVNGDGFPDVIAACELAHLVYFQNPGENVRAGEWDRVIPKVTLNKGSYIRVFFADFNNDGTWEVVAPNKGSQEGNAETSPPSSISYFEIPENPLEGDKWIEHELKRVLVPINSEVLDFDQDGDEDIVAGSRGEGKIFWFENISGPDRIMFVEHPILIEGSSKANEDHIFPYTNVTGFNMDYYDLNQDGKLDIILTEGLFEYLVYLIQPDDPVKPWKLHTIGNILPDQLVGLVIADINGDSLPDVMTGSYSRGPRDTDGEVSIQDPLGRLAWFEHPEDLSQVWIRHDISRRKRGMFDKFVPKDMDLDGDMDFVGTRGNSYPYDGVFWLEQIRSTKKPDKIFHPARANESEEVLVP